MFGPGFWVGWAIGTLAAIVVCVAFNPPFVVALFLGFGLSGAFGCLGEEFDR